MQYTIPYCLEALLKIFIHGLKKGGVVIQMNTDRSSSKQKP